MIADDQTGVLVSIIDAQGSTPREVGAFMWVQAAGIDGTIGGGALEWQAIATARKLLLDTKQDWARDTATISLGPGIGQCCGGRVRLLFERLSGAQRRMRHPTRDAIAIVPIESGKAPILIQARQDARDLAPELRELVGAMASGRKSAQSTLLRVGSSDYWIAPALESGPPVFLYGAGHVSRAIIRMAADLPWAIHWIDIDPARFPDTMPAAITKVIAADPARIAEAAPDDAWHLVITHSHALDLNICERILRKDRFAYLGVIGSSTKRARFQRQLADSGIQPAAIKRMICPIGSSAIAGKSPALIALSVLADLAARIEARDRQTSDLNPREVG
jgi:xanthine dehydrogenase accessory factor